MGCKLSVSVVHPENIVKKIKESMSPTSKRSLKKTDSNIKVKPESPPSSPDPPDSPESIDIYKTIYVDSP